MLRAPHVDTFEQRSTLFVGRSEEICQSASWTTAFLNVSAITSSNAVVVGIVGAIV
jgi:hypothetical protein